MGADSLGGIPEIHLSRLKPLPKMFGGNQGLGESVVAANSENENGLLIILSVNRIAERLEELIAATKVPPLI